uniref:Protein kinase domain-containing protein n=1 Tax=Vannella robusta TaxID=1487602 RepID=A0A7S4I5Y8_9EUKA|mmetsp:Transcript_20800/g.26305  ORF Transcript_20800/g.26305 Transcript_20800/m.26305 type:complete len:528 (+) Transcript_20800:33-1616(+)
MAFSKEDLLASLSLGSSEPEAITIGAEMSLEDLEAQCALLPDNDLSPGPTRAAKKVRNPSQPDQRRSITGRPEEMLQSTAATKRHGGKQAIQVGQYQLGQKLGKGAFGVVFKALDIKTGQFVAVKRIDKEKVDAKSMMKEINFLKTFNHPNIVSYVNLIQTDKYMHLILEFVDSGSLAQVLAGYGFFPESLAAIYTVQVLEGLAYLHEKDVIHRDIKGGNILITRDGSIKLADFGIATVASSNPRHSLVEGSPYWMAPEAIEMSAAPNTKSDIWSLGCTLIELITGVPPYFEMTSVSACFKMVSEERPPLPQDISKELEDFLICCFRRPVDTRPDARELMSHPWITKHVQSSKTTGDVEQVRRTIKRHTMGKEASKLKQDLKNLDFDAKTFEEAVSTTPERQRSNTWKGAQAKGKAPPVKLTIYSVETRRSIFTYTIYHVKVVKTSESGQETYNIERTWSDFSEAHSALQLDFPGMALPPCPPRKYWGVMDPEFVRKRWQELQKMVDLLVAIPSIVKSQTFQKLCAK